MSWLRNIMSCASKKIMKCTSGPPGGYKAINRVHQGLGPVGRDTLNPKQIRSRFPLRRSVFLMTRVTRVTHWYTCSPPVSGDPIVVPHSKRAEHNSGGATHAAQRTCQWEDTHSNGLLRENSHCSIILRIRWLKRKDSAAVFYHLAHNWVPSVLYSSELHHPQFFKAT